MALTYNDIKEMSNQQLIGNEELIVSWNETKLNDNRENELKLINDMVKDVNKFKHKFNIYTDFEEEKIVEIVDNFIQLLFDMAALRRK